MPDSDVIALKVNNGYDATLIYRAEIGYANGQHQASTVCPVTAITSFESWSDPLAEIDLSGFRLMAPRDPHDMTVDQCR